MRFLVDAQLPPGLAQWLRDQGYEADHVADCGLAGADDLAIWSHAITLAAVLMTKDEDFVTIRSHADSGPAVVWLRIGNATNRALTKWISNAFPAMIAALDAGETVIEVR